MLCNNESKHDMHRGREGKLFQAFMPIIYSFHKNFKRFNTEKKYHSRSSLYTVLFSPERGCHWPFDPIRLHSPADLQPYSVPSSSPNFILEITHTYGISFAIGPCSSPFTITWRSDRLPHRIKTTPKHAHKHRRPIIP